MSRHRKRREPRAHWFLLALGLVVLLAELMLNGVINHVGAEGIAVGPASTDSAEVPDALLNGGPVIRITGDTVATRAMPARTIALTFDDGPDPRVDAADPRRAARQHAPRHVLRDRLAGQRVPRPGPADPRRGPRARRAHVHPRRPRRRARRGASDLELTLTQNAIAAATGRTVRR